MNDYEKLLEEQNEQLQHRLATVEGVLNSLVAYEKTKSFFLYNISIKHDTNEWNTWSYGPNRKSLLKSFNLFKHSFISNITRIRIECNKYNKTQQYAHYVSENCWRIYLDVNNENKLIINRFTTYNGINTESIEGDEFDKHLNRWIK
jgi:hypothetical protein